MSFSIIWNLGLNKTNNVGILHLQSVGHVGISQASLSAAVTLYQPCHCSVLLMPSDLQCAVSNSLWPFSVCNAVQWCVFAILWSLQFWGLFRAGQCYTFNPPALVCVWCTLSNSVVCIKVLLLLHSLDQCMLCYVAVLCSVMYVMLHCGAVQCNVCYVTLRCSAVQCMLCYIAVQCSVMYVMLHCGAVQCNASLVLCCLLRTQYHMWQPALWTL